MALAPGWQEVQTSTQQGDKNHPSVEDSFALLTQTFPTRYTNLDPGMLRSKMDSNRPHPSGNKVTSLRIFSRFDVASVIDITAFYFVRLKFCPEAFTVTVGTSLLDGTVLYNALFQIFQAAQQHPQVPRIEIIDVNQVPGDPQGMGGAKAVLGAFNYGLNITKKITPLPDIYLGPPWCPQKSTRFYRWLCVTN